jgi:hypothetical protein
VHDDCQARRWHGKPPSPCVDVALCDAASREATREVMHALGAHGEPSWRLSAGPMCHRLAHTIRDMLAQGADGGASGGAGVSKMRHRLMLISAHDTSIFALLNAISGDYRHMCVASARGGLWPPYCSCVTIDVLRNSTIRLRYQLESIPPCNVEAAAMAEGGVQGRGGQIGVEEAGRMLDRLDALAMDPREFRAQCPEVYSSAAGGHSGTVFRWGA